MGKRIGFGGQAATDQRLYYINTKELVGNKYGTPNPVPFRVVDQRAGIDIDIAIRCFGEYSYRIVNPILFYTNVCGNVDAYTRDALDGQLRTELMTALQPAFARISEQGIRYSSLPAHTTELADALNQALSAKWSKLRGIEIVSLGVSGVKASEEDEQMIKDLPAQCRLHGPHPRGRPPRRRTGSGHAVRCRQHLRRPRHGLYGHESGCRCGRRQCTDPVPDGCPAACSARCPGGKRLDLLLRPERQHRQVLHLLRPAEARSPDGLGVQLRREEQRQILLRVRQAEARRQVPKLRF